MMLNRHVAICITFIFCSLIFEGIDGNSQTSCLMPPKFKNYFDFNWESRNNEWKNTKSQTDYFVFSLSW